MRISDWSSDVCSSDLLLDQRVIAFAVAFGRLDLDGQLVAGFLAEQRLFEAGDDVAATMQIDEGLVALRAVDNVALRVGQRVVHRNDALVCAFHRSSGALKTEGDRKSVGSGKNGTGRVDPGGNCYLKKKKKI